MMRRARGRHTVRHLGAAAIPVPDLVTVLRGYEPRGDALDLGAPNDELANWLAGHFDNYRRYQPPVGEMFSEVLADADLTLPIPDGPVGVFMNGRVHIAPATFDPPEDSPYARMCRHLDDMQPTIRQLTQKV
ncbi:hypothetical protein KNU39_gp75 [Gordonia phage Mutzi]|uniref:Uncharacterized protein n=1 Tax=Gordonia phage Mutzi TaxID=2500789 RepID=A0A411AXT6_9CAUD|nr:hypothetical protein KNU39_gp75 [Gordonia phage Mutzi]QAX92885.1 hypothetical protein SEA_MUTZI_75 [Gordonia phage Mutzi]QWY84762.1 hypothetical protein SEA_YUNGMONEY_76 [Gordonia phage YungMoney]